MEPKKHTVRTPVPGGEQMEVHDLQEPASDNFFDSFFEDDEGFLDKFEVEDAIEQQKQRIEALKRAIDIAKLMSNVTTEDILDIANKLIDFMKNTEI